jgi:hypothetical protein
LPSESPKVTVGSKIGRWALYALIGAGLLLWLAADWESARWAAVVVVGLYTLAHIVTEHEGKRASEIYELHAKLEHQTDILEELQTRMRQLDRDRGAPPL